MRMASSVAQKFGPPVGRDLRWSLQFAPRAFFRFLFAWTVEGDTVLTDEIVFLMRRKYAVFYGIGMVFLAAHFPTHTKTNHHLSVFFSY